MINIRKHGTPPYTVAVLHGGPGAPGEVAPVARELAKSMGVLEPFQTAITVEGQIEELKIQLTENAALPVTLIGYSWGAWLGWLLAAKHPELVRKLILVSSGVFEAKYAKRLMDTRKSRLSVKEQQELSGLLEDMQSVGESDKNATLARFGALMTKADSYAVLPEDELYESIECDMAVFQGVWSEAAALRESGELLALGKQIRCPVVAIHGDYDPGPTEGIQKPLTSVLSDFEFVLLERCGHTPWKERYARKRFYEVLRDALI
ncbi:alpha/beta fold hydrolase [Kosmotoga pacifica]|uniref:Alpha/beta hydrolase n=2 Tax=Kosmotoga pacifica TaxID=1330330 RepID=A0A0G2ZAB2_9BACT|nr:alpha/beta hydrolase [Kosmotoga pacifica]AKI96514.1 alpha/beta hydrolase [Kosmotoga pacifica]